MLSWLLLLLLCSEERNHRKIMVGCFKIIKYKQRNGCIVYTRDKTGTGHHCVYTNSYDLEQTPSPDKRPVERGGNDEINNNVTEVRHTIVKCIIKQLFKDIQSGERLKRPHPPPPSPTTTAKKFKNNKNVQAMTTKLFLGTFLFLRTFQSRRDVYVNIDVTMATEFWQPCFRNCYKKDLFLF